MEGWGFGSEANEEGSDLSPQKLHEKMSFQYTPHVEGTWNSLFCVELMFLESFQNQRKKDISFKIEVLSLHPAGA